MSDSQNFDLIVIGAGPGGYVAAIRAAQLDMKVALVEKMESLGGTCLNVGCIPSKAMLDSSGHFHSVNHSFADHGISVKSASVDLEKMIGRKFSVVKKLTDGVAGLIKGNKIARVDGIGVLVPASADAGTHSVEVYKNKQPVWEQSLGGIAQKADGSVGAKSKPSTVLSAPKIVLAMGSQPVELPFMPFDGESIVSSTGALSLKDIPKSMLIVGAGAIGLEMAQVWASLGTKVTVVEMMKQILPGWDAQIAKTMQRELKAIGVEFLLGNSVKEAKQLKSGIKVTLESDPGDMTVEKVLVAVGRRPALGSAGISEAGVSLTGDGRRIAVDSDYQTSVPGVYAIGDLVPGPMLAHKAEDEAVVCIERMNDIPAHLDYEVIPGVVYTHPEGATVGKSEEALKAEKIDYNKGNFPLAANGRALALGASGGFVKILADKKTDRILGAHIVGPWASDLIAEIVGIMEMKGSAEDIARIVHAHPTLPEAVKEAAMAVHGRSIHSLR